jgi:hypothetical protein
MIAALRKNPDLAALYPPAADEGLVLSWIYAAGQSDPWSWTKFVKAIASPEAVFWSVSNVAGIKLPGDETRLPDGLTLVPREPDLLHKRFPWWHDWLDETLKAETPFHDIETVLVHEWHQPRTPDGWALTTSGNPSAPMDRLLSALRLAGTSNLWVGPKYMGRAGTFDSRAVMTHIGPNMRPFTEALSFNRRRVLNYYLTLKALDSRLEKDLSHIGTALRRFNQAFDRAYPLAADALVDDVTALEGLVGRDAPELRFSLAFRVSAMLERSDVGRSRMFQDVSDFYNTRSRIVHGDQLKPKEGALISREDDLRAIVRRLVSGLLACAGTDYDPTPNFIDKTLDGLLMAEGSRRKLVTAMSRVPKA